MFFHGDQVFICFTVRFWGKRILFHQLPCGYSTLGDVCFKPRLWKLGKLQKNTTSHWRGCFASWKVIPDDQTGCEIRSKPPKWWLKAQQNKGIWYTIYQLVIRISQASTEAPKLSPPEKCCGRGNMRKKKKKLFTGWFFSPRDRIEALQLRPTN